MVEQICAYIHNFFDMDQHRQYYHRERGEFTITDGSIALDFLKPGQYFRIAGSALNDGVYEYPATGLLEETFTGIIYEMRVPASFRALVTEIVAWQAKYGATVANPYQSENFVDYSYSKGSHSGANGKSGPVTWQSVFGSRLNQWRKLA